MDKMIKIVSQVQQDQKKLSSQDEPRANQPNTGFFDVFKNLCGNFEIKLVSLTHVLEDEWILNVISSIVLNKLSFWTTK